MVLIPLLAALVFAPAQGKLIKKDIVVGKGPACKSGDSLTVDYKGMFTSGKPFDSSYGKAPLSFTLGASEVIKGWDQGIPGMKVGGTRVLTIPPQLAYGKTGVQGIPPNSTLKFEVKLLHIRPKGSIAKISVKELKAGKGRAAK